MTPKWNDDDDDELFEADTSISNEPSEFTSLDLCYA